MATQSVERDQHGPEWPLGLITLVTPGTPVNIMSLVDTASPQVNAPETPLQPSQTPAATQQEYTVLAQQIIFQAFKNAANGLVSNAGNIYIMRKGVQGAGNRNDYGAMVACILPGQTFFLSSAPRNRNEFSPYRYWLDGDSAGDCCLVTLLIG